MARNRHKGRVSVWAADVDPFTAPRIGKISFLEAKRQIEEGTAIILPDNRGIQKVSTKSADDSSLVSLESVASISANEVVLYSGAAFPEISSGVRRAVAKVDTYCTIGDTKAIRVPGCSGSEFSRLRTLPINRPYFVPPEQAKARHANN